MLCADFLTELDPTIAFLNNFSTYVCNQLALYCIMAICHVTNSMNHTHLFSLILAIHDTMNGLLTAKCEARTYSIIVFLVFYKSIFRVFKSLFDLLSNAYRLIQTN